MTMFKGTLTVILLFVAILQVHIADLKINSVHHTAQWLNAPQRKKEIERYGEREKLHISTFKSKILGSGPPAPPLVLSPPFVCS